MSQSIVRGTIEFIDDDLCIVDLGKYGKGRLIQEHSNARDEPYLLSELAAYEKGHKIEVFLDRKHNGDWHVNERWAKNNPWAKLKLHRGSVVTGRVRGSAPGGYFVLLDEPDINVWLSTKELPWADGGTDEEPSTKGVDRLELIDDDRVMALVTRIRTPPDRPAISVKQALEKQEEQSINQFARSGSDRKFVARQKLLYGARIKGDLGAFRQRLTEQYDKQPLQDRCILVIDDQKEPLEALVGLLKHNGAVVDAESMEDCMDTVFRKVENRLSKKKYDIILIDYSLPKLGDGIVMARHIRNLSPSMWIIVFSGYPLTRENMEELREAGVDDFMCKPLRLGALVESIEGKAVWESDGGDAKSPVSNTGAVDDEASSPDFLLRKLFETCRLRYVVLLQIVGLHGLEAVSSFGEFPTDSKKLAMIIANSGLKTLIRGLKDKLQVNSSESRANEGLHPYSNHALFLPLRVESEDSTSHIIGVGWDPDTVPFTEQSLQSLARLLEAKLLQQEYWTQLQTQLPFVTQGQLLAGLSHEISNRLSPWLHYQQTVRAIWRHYPSCVDSQDKRMLESEMEKAISGMEHASSHLNELLYLMLRGLNQSGAECRLRPLLRLVREIFLGELQEQGFEFQLDPNKAPDISAGFSPLYLLQPLSNLILNSRKHMHRVRRRRIAVTATLPDIGEERNHFIVDVDDNGPGIPAHVVPDIFKPGFSQAPRASERTGMGLYISRILVEQIGGTLELEENWRGFGCRFRLILPLVI